MKTESILMNDLNFLSVLSSQVEKKDHLKLNYMKMRKKSILSVANKITGDRTAALKITRAVFLIGRNKIDSFATLSAFNIWLHRSAAQLSMQYKIDIRQKMAS